MKSVCFFLILLCLLAACRKQLQLPGMFPEVSTELKDSLPAEIYQQLDFNSSIFTRANGQDYLRIGFKTAGIEEHFLLLGLSESGTIEQGRCVEIEVHSRDGIANGQISLGYLNGSVILDHAMITGGYIHWHHAAIGLREMLVPGADGKVLPEVIVVAQQKPNFSLTTYYSLAGIMGGGGYTNSGYYSSSKPAGPGGSAPSAGTGDSKTGGAPNGKTGKDAGPPDLILVDFEQAQQNPSINLDQYIKCFAGVPDNGAACTIEILADIPVDGHPEAFFNWNNGSPGHCFLRLQKTNGLNSVLQVIGFYPQSGWKTFTTPAPVAGKFVDNGGHEFNASLRMTISALQLQSILIELGRHKGDKYDIDEYNCTDFALEIFNYQRTSKLVIPKYDLPGGQAPFGTNTPQGLYVQLKAMKTAGGPESANINIPGVKGFEANSKGPCN